MDLLGDLMGVDESGIARKESNIPAGYTYLGQFIDHDITLEPFSSVDSVQVPSQTLNMRTPCLDLDSLYGGGPAVSRHLYDHGPNLSLQVRGLKFLLGENRNVGPGGPHTSVGAIGVPSDFDLPRTSDRTAIIGDPRNDENLFVSQLHHAFLKFHNRVVDQLSLEGVSRDELFDRARETVTHHYQWIVVHDFLRRILVDKLLADVFDDENLIFFPQRANNQNPFRLPVEFTVGAYRFGHSMVRDKYDFNNNFRDALTNNSFLNAFNFVSRQRLPVFSNWVIDWNRFFDTGITFGDDFKINMAMKIDTNMALSLESLPSDLNEQAPGSSSMPNFKAILASRNLRRGLAFKLPSGQAVSRKCNLQPMQSLKDLLSQKVKLTINRLVPKNDIPKELRLAKVPFERPLKILDRKLLLFLTNKELARKTPLWYYVLREAETKGKGNQLGPCGGRIIAETFYRMLKDDPESYLNKGFTPHLDRIQGKPNGDFDMADLLNFAGVLSLK
ncbi:MAG: hypothetical protein KTR24_13725 [Saprospiraceae bacterium]|nr:hypothetical protein [Saprospiraceae bacterium]